MMECEKKRMRIELDRADLFEPSVYISMILTLEGEVSEKEISEAVKKAYTQNQTTMSKVVLEDDGAAYFEEMPETGCKVFIDNRDWQEILCESQRDPFRINEGELIRTYIIPDGQKKTIYMMVHHLTGDGMAVLIFAEDIISNLQEREVEYKPQKLIRKQDVSKKGQLGFFKKLGLHIVNYKWNKTKKIFTWDDYYKIHETFWKDKCSDIVVETIEGSAFDEMIDECKRMEITVNSYIVTKLLQQHPNCRKVGIPVNLRAHLRGDLRTISNRVTSVFVLHDYDPSKSFEENAREVHAKVKKESNDEAAISYLGNILKIVEETLIDAALMHTHLGYDNEMAKTMAGLVGYVGDKGVELGTTNLGKIDGVSGGDRFKITELWGVPPKMSYSKIVIGITTYRNKLVIAEHRFKERKG